VDLTRQIGYRGFAANTLTKDPNNALYGCEVKRVQYPGVDGVGYDEKSAQSDGYDASDVYLGKRVLQLTMAAYGRTRGECWDYWQQAVSAFTPSAAYLDSPGDKGFLPLDFYVPTSNLIDFPDGYIHKQILARPVRQPTIIWESDIHGGFDDRPASMQFTVLLEAIDPRVYGFIPQEWDIYDQLPVHAGDLTNLGDYPSPLNILLEVQSGTGGSFHFVGAGTDMVITVDNESYTQTVRYSASKKVLTVEIQNVETLRMDSLTFNQQTTHPLVPVGTSAFTFSINGGLTVLDGTRFWFWDAWA